MRLKDVQNQIAMAGLAEGEEWSLYAKGSYKAHQYQIEIRKDQKMYAGYVANQTLYGSSAEDVKAKIKKLVDELDHVSH